MPWQPDYLSASPEGVNELLFPRRKQGDKNSHIDEHNLLYKENTRTASQRCHRIAKAFHKWHTTYHREIVMVFLVVSLMRFVERIPPLIESML